MTQYLIRRLLLALPVLFGVSVLVFSLLRIVPGDVVVAMAAEAGNIDPDQEAALRHELGLDRPFVPQYLDWASGLVRGDFGASLWTGRPVTEDIRRTLPVTLELAGLALVLSVVVGLTVGVVSAIKHDTILDHVTRLLSVGALSVPDFALGTVVLLLLTVQVGWTPPVGFVSLVDHPWVNLQQVLIPAAIIGLRYSAVTARMTRTMMLEVLREDYVRTAHAKGLRPTTVVVRHTLRNALIPVITTLGSQLGYLVSGSIVIEAIFGLPGFGTLMVDAITVRDYPVVQASILLVAVMLVVINLVIDVSYHVLDPRLKVY